MTAPDPLSPEERDAVAHVLRQDAGWQDYNATNRAAVLCARALDRLVSECRRLAAPATDEPECQCGTGEEPHVRGGYRACEFWRHHCDECHASGACTLPECLPPTGKDVSK